MPRRGEVPKRKTVPDPKYKDRLVAKMMNTVMISGEKAIAERIVYGAFDVIQERFKEDPLEVFRRALDNVKPKVEVKSRRVGGATYQVPVEVRPERRVSLAMRWITLYSRSRGEKSMRERLANELMEASQGRGSAVKKKEDTHKMADANRAFAHYRW
jgi:small subunit ribosomal protein S7